MLVSYEGHIEIVKYLVKNGANINTKNNDGNTALDVVKENESKRYIVKYLKRRV